MNTNLIKRIGLYILGAVLGGGAGALIANHFFEEVELPDGSTMWVRKGNTYGWTEGEIDGDLTDEQRQDIEEGREIVETVTYEPINDGVVVKEKKAKKKGPNAPRPNTPRPGVDTVDYNRFSKTAHKDKTVGQVAQEIGVEQEVVPGKPYVISMMEFLDPKNAYSQEVMVFYEDDDTLADSAENPVPNPEELLGDGLHNFGLSSEDPDVVFVRNDKLQTNYEVSRVHNKYTVVVMGIPDPVEPKSRSRQRVRTQKVNKLNDDDEEA